MLSKEAIQEFHMLYKAQYGQDISMDEAAAKGEGLRWLYKAVYKPSSIDNTKAYGEQTTGHNPGN